MEFLDEVKGEEIDLVLLCFLPFFAMGIGNYPGMMGSALKELYSFSALLFADFLCAECLFFLVKFYDFSFFDFMYSLLVFPESGSLLEKTKVSGSGTQKPSFFAWLPL